MRPWIQNKLIEILGFDDDVILELILNLLISQPGISNLTQKDPRKIQIELTGFLESSTYQFMSELWNLLLSAQNSLGGIPQSFLDAKKAELKIKEVFNKFYYSGRGCVS